MSLFLTRTAWECERVLLVSSIRTDQSSELCVACTGDAASVLRCTGDAASVLRRHPCCPFTIPFDGLLLSHT
jgi:hypothetical protein